ncbi:hypothetical protein YDYSG_35900 [Paenibacillus tyrfis]|nr:hypothetical protein YDYSG_35900 [Paenibacillus tyrfis]GMX62399.1 hypothetical protein Elgi_22040 [Paenibacillus elgii]
MRACPEGTKAFLRERPFNAGPAAGTPLSGVQRAQPFGVLPTREDLGGYPLEEDQ